MPLSGRGGARATLDRKRSIPPPRSAPAAGYPALREPRTVVRRHSRLPLDPDRLGRTIAANENPGKVLLDVRAFLGRAVELKLVEQPTVGLEAGVRLPILTKRPARHRPM